MTKANKTATPIFVFSLQKIIQQAFHNGQLTKNYITFNLKELVELGLYGRTEEARRGVRTAFKILRSFTISGVQHYKNKGYYELNDRQLFLEDEIKNGQCTIYINDRFQWDSFIGQFYYKLPRYYFNRTLLNSKARDLLYYICYLARQHTSPKDIKTRKVKYTDGEGNEHTTSEKYIEFNISYRSVQTRLNLPNEDETKDPNGKIIGVIDDAIERIEEAHRQIYNNMDFRILPNYRENATAREKLNEGYLTISLYSKFAEDIINRANETIDAIKEANRKAITSKKE